jgi:hypothetical protein
LEHRIGAGFGGASEFIVDLRTKLPTSSFGRRTIINTQEHTKTTGSRPEELRDASRHGTPAQGFEDWEQQGTQAVRETPREDDLMDNGDGVDMQQQEEVRGKWLIKEDYDSQKKKKNHAEHIAYGIRLK